MHDRVGTMLSFNPSNQTEPFKGVLMMKRFLMVSLCLGLSLILILTGCSTGQPSKPVITEPSQINPTESAGPGSAVDLMAGIAAADWSGYAFAPETSQLQAVQRFSAAFFQRAANQPGNLMVSPASVFLALAMTVNGAEGATRAAMLEALTQQGMTVEAVNAFSRGWIASLDRAGEAATVSISNGIWFDQDFAPEQAFLQTNADFYRAAARKLDFTDPSAVTTINRWVSEATRGKIEQIVDKIDDNVVMYLINAIYFLADWQTQFDANDTRDQVFRAPTGEVTVPFMHRTGDMTYFNGLSSEGVALPYADGAFVFFALLPNGALTPRDWLAAQDPATLCGDLSQLVATPSTGLELSLPKFESRYEDSLKDELSDLGMGLAFAPGEADFAGMTANKDLELYINEVRHKTFVRVDEKGTEAAAVTSVEVGLTSMPVSERQLVFDRPFVYGILDTATGLPLFVGILEHPGA